MSRFTVNETGLAGLYKLERQLLGDNRGFLDRLYCETDLEECLAGKIVRQVNRTLTTNKGALRGMHFQYPPHAETKIVSCLRGKVWDVAVDLRMGSTTFLHHYGVILSAENNQSLILPEGFAHGFQCLEDNSEMLYFHTANYNPAAEGGVNALDPALDIEWPLRVAERSDRDVEHPMLTSEFLGIEI